MLLKKNRLNKRKDFEKVLKGARGLKSDFLYLKGADNELETTRIGFIVSQKVSRRAVVRNKLKRQLREIVKPELERIRKGKDLIFIALPGIEKQSFPEVKKAVDCLLKKSGLLTSP